MSVSSDSFTDALEKLRIAREAVVLMPNSREKSIVLTKLDEARLWLQEDILRHQIADPIL